MAHVLMQWPTLIVLAVVCVATFTDLRSRRIPNWLVLPFFVVGVAVSCFLHGWHGLGHSLGGAGLGSVAVRNSFLYGRHGRRRCEVVRGDRGLDRPDAIDLCPGIHRFGGRSDGIGVGGVGRVPEGTFPAHRRPGIWFETRTRRGCVNKSPAAQDAVCASHRDRNVYFVLCALKEVGNRCLAYIKPDTRLTRTPPLSRKSTARRGAQVAWLQIFPRTW